MAALFPIFQRDHVAIVAEHGRFVGLITRIDLLNYLRKQLTTAARRSVPCLGSVDKAGPHAVLT